MNSSAQPESAAQPQNQFTSFGFLSEETEQPESLFDLGSIFTRVKKAFVAQESPAEESTTTVVADQNASRAPSSADTAGIATSSSTHASSGAVKQDVGQTISTSHQRKSSKTFPTVPDSLSSSKEETVPPQRALKAEGRIRDGRKPFSAIKATVPFALSSSRQAPAVTSTTAAHAVSRQRHQSLTMSDDHSVAADDGEAYDGEDVLTSLMRKSGVDHTRFNAGRYSSVPGFPLPKDLLADDTRSIHSSSSRMPRSEINSTSEAHFVVAHSHPRPRHDSRAGLGTSAEAFRRMRGEGAVLSKAFWMPDENVKECRECQSYFTPFRRKHHCRICGLVYCSRCASNLIPGSRFGLEGSEIRVCNFCLRMFSEYERAGLRSSTSTSSLTSSPKRIATTYARKRTESTGFGSRPDKGMISSPLEAQAIQPQAQFAASQLFAYPRSSVSKGLPRMISLQDMLGEMEGSPPKGLPNGDLLSNDILGEADEVQKDEPVPFRSKLSEEDGILRGDDELGAYEIDEDASRVAVPQDENSPAKRTNPSKRIAFPAIGVDHPTPQSSIRLREARTKRLGEPILADVRQRLVSDAALRALRRSKLKAREASEDEGRLSSRTFGSPATFLSRSNTKRDSFVGTFLSSSSSPLEELSEMSLLHLSAVLRQSLHASNLSNQQQWVNILEPLILAIIRNIHPNPRVGESMDIRQYIKIKRIPGGAISDSCYVAGFVLSKQVATKKMARSLPLSNPRVMVVTFPIDFHRAEGQFMSLEPLMAQEHEYTRILVARILQLRPNLVVVKDTVSRLALEMLEDAGVVVVWSIKLSAVQAISRCCQADVISSIDRLALEPRLGRCASFGIETYQHAHSPGSRKSMMRFLTSGSARSLGCTILLRGGKEEMLGRAKQVVSLLAFVANNLRLEEQVSRNEGTIVMPAPQVKVAAETLESKEESDYLTADDVDADRMRKALQTFAGKMLSASAGITITPPHPLVQVLESHEHVRALQHQCQSERERTESEASKDANTGEKDGEPEGLIDDQKTPTTEKAAVKLPTLEEALPRPSDVQASYARAVLEHRVYLDDWKACASIDPISRLETLDVLWALMSSATQKPCMGPHLLSWKFYGHGDESLGHFLERTCNEADTMCSAKGCGRPRGLHYQTFVHNETRIQVVVEKFVCPIPGQEDRLLMWSYCKQCEQATPVTPVSDDTWSFSFAKYVELHFYDVNKTTSHCSHNYYVDSIRFFSLQNLAIRFHRDRDLTVREVILPPLHLLPRPDVDYKLKVEGAKSMQSRMDAYWASVLERMGALRREPHLSVQHISQLDAAMQTAHGDENDLRAFLIKTCQTSKDTDILALNAVRNRLQAAVVRWDQFFQEFERSALPNERDVRRLTSHHLSRLFQEKSDSSGGQNVERAVEAVGLTPAPEVDESASSSGGEGSAAKSLVSPDLVTLCTEKTEKGSGNADAMSMSQEAESESVAPSTATSPILSSPSIWRQRRSNTMHEVSEPSATADASLQKPKDSEAKHLRGTVRPGMRRGRTSDAVPGHTSELPITIKGSAAENPMMLPRMHQPSSGPAGPSGRRNAAVPRRGPPSSYRPPKSILAASSGMETESDGGATSSSSIPTARRKQSIGQRRGRNIAASSGGVTRENQSETPARSISKVPLPIRASKVSTIARRFDNLQKEAEKERERQRAVMAMRARRARPVAASQATVHVYHNVKDLVDDDDESDSPDTDNDGEAEDEEEEEEVKAAASRQTTKRSMNASNEVRNEEVGLVRPKTDVLPPLDSVEQCLPSDAESSPGMERRLAMPDDAACRTALALDGTPESAAAEMTVSSLLSGTLPASWRASLIPDGDSQDSRGSLLKTITSLWGRTNAHLPLIELPMSATEHLFTDSPLVVLREDEPSSLIAFTLSSSTYSSRLKTLRQVQAKESLEPAISVDEKQRDDPAGLESTLRQSEGSHLSFQFSSGDSRFSIRVLFVEQFASLRQVCQCTSTFVQSLARCSNWADCSGGKSGATMMKTLDGRFVLKELSRAEMDAFANNAGAYFRYLADVLFQDRPTTLAKTYGVYRLTIRNAHTGKYIKLDCAVTENVFTNAGKMGQIYDLKGALRNRFIQPNGLPSQVLLDGNLVKAKEPIFLRENAKKRLREALYHDSLFLANCDVMDYSLVLGVSADASEVFVGMIDYIHTFTRSKKLESLFKEAVGGGAEAPTIISPKQYRLRFLAFLDSILLLSPDHWLSREEGARSAACPASLAQQG